MSRLFKVLVILAGGAILLVLCDLLLNQFTERQARRALNDKLAELKSAGEPVVLADLGKPTVPSAENAAILLKRLQPDIDAINRQIRNLSESDYEQLERGKLTPAVRQMLQDEFENRPELVPQLTTAGLLPHCDPRAPLNFGVDAFEESTDEHLDVTRHGVHVLDAYVLLKLSEDKRDEAGQAVVVMYQLARQSENVGTLISYVLAIGCRMTAGRGAARVLLAGPISDQVRDALEAEFALVDNGDAYRQALITDRVEGLERFYEWYAEYCSGRYNLVFLPTMLLNQATTFLEYFDEPFGWHSKLYSDVANLQALRNPPEGLFLSVMIPPLDPVLVGVHQNRTMGRALRILSAIQKANVSEDPSSQVIEHLGLPPEVLVDSFNGKPLTIRKQPGGWLIYSVGKNLRDDNGRLYEFQDVGVGPEEAWEPTAEPSPY